MNWLIIVILFVLLLDDERRVKNVIKWNTLDGLPTKIFAHRGEKVMMPEHTIGSYHLAAIEGADFVEPDLVSTKDGHLVCYHDLFIKDGTDVANHPEFAHLQRTFDGILDGKPRIIKDEWFIQDFTLAELKTLKVKQKKIGVRPLYFNHVFEIPTFEEYLTLIQDMSYQLDKKIGLVPELKHPEHHNAMRPDEPRWFENKVLHTLREFGYPTNSSDVEACKTRTHDPENDLITESPFPCGQVVLQNFDFESLKYLRSKSDLIPLVMLVDDDPTLFTHKGLDEVAKYANWYSPWKEYAFVGVEAELERRGIKWNQTEIANLGGFIDVDSFVQEIHSRNLRFVPFTFYDSREPSKRGCAVKCLPEDKRSEFFYFFQLGTDGMFVENTPEAIELRTQYNSKMIDFDS